MNVLRKATKEERKFLGVCGGVSRFLDPEMDPIVIRLTTLALMFLWPPMIILYLIAAAVLKTHEAPFNREQWIRDYADKYDIDLSKKEEDKDLEEE